MMQNNVKPLIFHIEIPNRFGYIMHTFQYCCAVTLEECEKMQPIHPYENKMRNLQATIL